jgi:hypothetical protein
MPPDHARDFAGGATQTTLSPVVLVALAVAVILILVLPRKYMIVPVSFMLILVPISQQVFVGGVHLFVSRIIILAGLCKMGLAGLTSQEKALGGGFNPVDRAYLWCLLCEACAVVVLFLNTDAVINQVGFLWDFVGGYFLMRYLIHDEADAFRAIKCFGLIALVVGFCMVREQFTLQNIFGLIGGHTVPEIREGRVRCLGPFAHELMAGAYGSTLVALLLLLWKFAKAKIMAALGLLGAMLMTWTSNSSTSLLSLAAGLLAISFWPIRKNMRKVRWGIALGLTGLHLVMKAPVWFLIARIDLTGGSSGYHRAELVDQFIRHFWDWWLIGVKGTGSWGWDLWDTQNQYVNVGETGGLLALILFIAMISRSFARLGNARKAVEGEGDREWIFWLLGSALFAHVVGFFGVNYFDQTKFVWFALLAMITAATAPLLQAVRLPEGQAEVGMKSAPLALARPSPLRPVLRKWGQVAQTQSKPRIL